jgi:hypothetical protein
MKKTLKVLLVSIIMGILIISLTGCGSDKIVATKLVEDETMGKYEEEVVVTFKKDKVEAIEMNMIFEDEETAQGMYGLFTLGMSMSEEGELDGIDVKQEGKKLTMKMDASAYAETEGVSDEEMTKEALKATLEEEGYKVK